MILKTFGSHFFIIKILILNIPIPQSSYIPFITISNIPSKLIPNFHYINLITFHNSNFQLPSQVSLNLRKTYSAFTHITTTFIAVKILFTTTYIQNQVHFLSNYTKNFHDDYYHYNFSN